MKVEGRINLLWNPVFHVLLQILLSNVILSNNSSIKAVFQIGWIWLDRVEILNLLCWSRMNRKTNLKLFQFFSLHRFGSFWIGLTLKIDKCAYAWIFSDLILSDLEWSGCGQPITQCDWTTMREWMTRKHNIVRSHSLSCYTAMLSCICL